MMMSLLWTTNSLNVRVEPFSPPALPDHRADFFKEAVKTLDGLLKCIAIFLDLIAKAYDNVSLKILIGKLEN